MTHPTRNKFDEAWAAEIAKNKYQKNICMEIGKYNRVIRELKYLQIKHMQGIYDTPEDRKLLRKYDIVVEDGREWLVKPAPHENVAANLLKYVFNLEMFDVLHEAHQSTNHGNFKEMTAQIQARYCNVSNLAVMTYLRLCQHCTNRNAMVSEILNYDLPQHEPPPMRPLKREFNLHGSYFSVYFGFINMQEYPRDGYEYIMVHWFLSNQFVHLIPLRNIEPNNVVISLMDIYGTFGLPNYIDAPFDMRYIHSIISHIKEAWSNEVSIAHRNPNDMNISQHGINMIHKTMEPWVNDANFRINWPLNLKYLQFWMNNQLKPGKVISYILIPTVQSTGAAATGLHLTDRYRAQRRLDTVDSPTTPQKRQGGRQVGPDEYRPMAIVLSYAN
jgi:hypothetical protein